MSYLGPTQIVRNVNAIMGILGTTKASFWPCFEGTGGLVSGIGLGDLVSAETGGAAEALEDDFAPIQHPGQNYSYHFHPTGDHHLAGIDSAAYTFVTGGADDPFSCGAWICPNDVTTTVIMAKYDAAGNAEEWRLFIDANSKLSLELHDASASTKEVGVTTSSLTIGKWVFVVAAYDGLDTSPTVTFYLNGVVDGDTTTTETGAYVCLEDTATPLTVGCDGVTALPTNEFHGRIALPFITGKCLTQAEVTSLYEVTKMMMGL